MVEVPWPQHSAAPTLHHHLPPVLRLEVLLVQAHQGPVLGGHQPLRQAGLLQEVQAAASHPREERGKFLGVLKKIEKKYQKHDRLWGWLNRSFIASLSDYIPLPYNPLLKSKVVKPFPILYFCNPIIPWKTYHYFYSLLLYWAVFFVFKVHSIAACSDF